MRSFFFFFFSLLFIHGSPLLRFLPLFLFFPFSRSISLPLASERKGDRVRKSVSSSGTAIWKTRSGRPWRWQSVLHAREGRSPVFFLYSIGLVLLFSLSLSFAPLISPRLAIIQRRLWFAPFFLRNLPSPSVHTIVHSASIPLPCHYFYV